MYLLLKAILCAAALLIPSVLVGMTAMSAADGSSTLLVWSDGLIAFMGMFAIMIILGMGLIVLLFAFGLLVA